MNSKRFDPTLYKIRQRKLWDEAAPGWDKWWPALEQAMRPVTQRLVELAQLQPGHRVLDIATGLGEPALTVAPRVRPGGVVIATDLSAKMLDIARRRAANLGLDNVHFKQVDGEALDYPPGSFDAVFCRFGLMFLPNVAHFLRTVRQTLAPGGKFLAAIWEEPPDLPPDDLAIAMAIEMFELPPPPDDVPSFYGLADGVLERAMAEAGFADVRTEKVVVDFEWSSIDACQQFIRDVIPFFAMIGQQPRERQEEFWRAHAAAVQQFALPEDGLRARNVAICVSGQV